MVRGERLAREPFKRAVRAQMHGGVDALPATEPQIKRDIGVARRQIRIVITRFTVRRGAAIGLYRDDEVPRPQIWQREPTVPHGFILVRRAPGGAYSGPHGGRQFGEEGFIVG